jgi:hypothetical protein
MCAAVRLLCSVQRAVGAGSGFWRQGRVIKMATADRIYKVEDKPFIYCISFHIAQSTKVQKYPAH